jgi:hypothetical protein
MISVAFTSSMLIAALLSPAKALELTAELTTAQEINPAFGEGPILMKPTASDPLSYHGTDKIYQHSNQVHSFW